MGKKTCRSGFAQQSLRQVSFLIYIHLFVLREKKRIHMLCVSQVSPVFRVCIRAVSQLIQTQTCEAFGTTYENKGYYLKRQAIPNSEYLYLVFSLKLWKALPKPPLIEQTMGLGMATRWIWTESRWTRIRVSSFVRPIFGSVDIADPVPDPGPKRVWLVFVFLYFLIVLRFP